jgi:hypothetical protein
MRRALVLANIVFRTAGVFDGWAHSCHDIHCVSPPSRKKGHIHRDIISFVHHIQVDRGERGSEILYEREGLCEEEECTGRA